MPSSHLPSARLPVLTLGALGVVYGDIGTSPLYTLRESFSPHLGIPADEANIFGFLSMIFWSLVIVITLKYVLYVMRADNKGEGGVMALTALTIRSLSKNSAMTDKLLLVGIIGAGLFYADGMITPAISVLSAVEGLTVIAPHLETFVLPVSCGILIGLFVLQRTGTAAIGRWFGLIMIVWFLTLGILGIRQIIAYPAILQAISPTFAVAFWETHRAAAFFSLGAVVLAVTGGEALYADMGHFGAKAVRIAWLGLVLPALVLNYFGQGALLAQHPEVISNPFYKMAPTWGLVPLILLATAAAIIAAQATISGAFSLTREAIQIGLIPRMRITQTSNEAIGQIYVPYVNWMLLGTVLLLVLSFRSSSHLAAAYGIAVTGTMVMTTILAFVVTRNLWRWPLWQSVLLTGFFLVIDLAFFGASLFKITEGGWFPLAVAGVICTCMWTWRCGRDVINRHMDASGVSVNAFLQRLGSRERNRVAGTAIFLAREPQRIPHALLHNLRHNKVLHKQVILLTVRTSDEPTVSRERKCFVEALPHEFYRVILTFGFAETPNIPEGLLACKSHCGLQINPLDCSYFIGRETLIPSAKPDLGKLQEYIYIFLANNASNAADFFGIPTNQVVELGRQLEV